MFITLLIVGDTGCWATSHDPCEKFQIVDLVDAGISEDKLDDKKPPITVRDWYVIQIILHNQDA